MVLYVVLEPFIYKRKMWYIDKRKVLRGDSLATHRAGLSLVAGHPFFYAFPTIDMTAL